MVFFACPRNHLTCISRVIKCLFDSMNLTHRTSGLKSTQRRFGQYIYMLLIQNILTYNPIYLFVCYTIEMAHAASYEPLMRCTNEFTTNKINKNYCQIWNINKTLGIQLEYKKRNQIQTEQFGRLNKITEKNREKHTNKMWRFYELCSVFFG